MRDITPSHTPPRVRQSRITLTGKRFWESRYLLLMILPAIAFFFIFCYIPMYGVIIAFKDYSLRRGILGSPWATPFTYHFDFFFSTPFFGRLMRNTLLISIYNLVIGFFPPIILAMMLNEVLSRTYKKVIQTMVYLPYFISWVVVGMLISLLFSSQTGAITVIMKQVFGFSEFKILSEPRFFRTLVVASNIWKGVGWGSIIYLAALTGLDPELYEAARIDGANKFHQIRYITIPGIIPVAVIMLILNAGGIMNSNFEQILILTNSNVAEISQVIDTYVYSIGIVGGEYSYTAAIGLFKSVIGMFLVLTVNFIAQRVGEVGLW